MRMVRNGRRRWLGFDAAMSSHPHTRRRAGAAACRRRHDLHAGRARGPARWMPASWSRRCRSWRRSPTLSAENVLGLPGPRSSSDQALELARRAADVAAGGAGVVITTGTDTLEEMAMLCALHHGGEAPIVLTGANRPASARRRRRAGQPARCGHPGRVGAAAAGLGDRRRVRRRDPRRGHRAQGRQHRPGGVRLAGRPGRSAGSSRGGSGFSAAVRPHRRHPAADHRSPGPDHHRRARRGRRASARRRPGRRRAGRRRLRRRPSDAGDAGRARQMRFAASRCVITVRPERGSMLHATYGFEGSERDLRASGAVCVPFLSARRGADRAAVLPGRRTGPRRHRRRAGALRRLITSPRRDARRRRRC